MIADGAPRTLAEIVRRHLDPEVHQFRGAFRDWMPSGVGTVFAPNSTGKSFVAIDAAIRKAAGRDLGPFVNPEPRPVLYLAPEDRDGIEFRIAATALDLGLDLSLPIVVAEPPREYGARDFASAVVEMAKWLFPGRPPGLVVVDTLGAGIGAGSLNDDVTAAPAMNQFHRLSALLDSATVLVLHHPSKTDARERGSGVIRDRADFAISLAADRTGRIVTATNVKMRNGAHGDRLVYRLGEINDGRRTATPGTTLRVMSIEGETARHQQQAAEAEPRSPAPLVRGDTLTALKVLDELQGVAPDRCTVAPLHSPIGGKPLHPRCKSGPRRRSARRGSERTKPLRRLALCRSTVTVAPFQTLGMKRFATPATHPPRALHPVLPPLGGERMQRLGKRRRQAKAKRHGRGPRLDRRTTRPRARVGRPRRRGREAPDRQHQEPTG